VPIGSNNTAYLGTPRFKLKVFRSITGSQWGPWETKELGYLAARVIQVIGVEVGPVTVEPAR
jgi:hypothetical protein